jgi:outer membrane lipoprotein-sorting protein
MSVAATLMIALLGLFSWMLPGNGPPALAFADVAEKLAEVRTATCKMCYWGTEGREEAKFLMAPGFTRFELNDGQVLIEDHRQRKCIRLNPDKKLANVWDMDNRIVVIDELAWENPLEMLREEVRDAKNRPDGEVEDLGTKQIDGRAAVGFRFKLKGKNQDTDKTIWADPKTGLPIRIEATTTGPGPSVQNSVLEDFRFNVKLDDSLFDVEPPEGYTVQKAPPM